MRTYYEIVFRVSLENHDFAVGKTDSRGCVALMDGAGSQLREMVTPNITHIHPARVGHALGSRSSSIVKRRRRTRA